MAGALGAGTHAEGFFTVSPRVEVATDFSAVASNKRAEARRRAELLQQTLGAVEQAVRASLPEVLSA